MKTLHDLIFVSHRRRTTLSGDRADTRVSAALTFTFGEFGHPLAAYSIALVSPAFAWVWIGKVIAIHRVAHLIESQIRPSLVDLLGSEEILTWEFKQTAARYAKPTQWLFYRGQPLALFLLPALIAASLVEVYFLEVFDVLTPSSSAAMKELKGFKELSFALFGLSLFFNLWAPLWWIKDDPYNGYKCTDRQDMGTFERFLTHILPWPSQNSAAQGANFGLSCRATRCDPR